ncbi:MAG: ribosome maturation factor RimM [Chloroflexota bacterium]
MTVRRPTTKANSGSPSTGEPEYLVVGTLMRPHGLLGEMLMNVITDFPARLVPGSKVFLGARYTPMTVGARRLHARGLLIRLQGIDTPEAAGAYRNHPVYVLSSDRPRLPAGQYYHHELLGSMVIVDADQRSIGTLVEILQTGANDVYVIKDAADREMLLPSIAGVVLGIDVHQHLIRVRVPDGMDIGVGQQRARPGSSDGRPKSSRRQRDAR